MMPPWLGDVADVLLLVLAVTVFAATLDQIARLFYLGRYAVRVRRAKRADRRREW